MKKLVLTVAIVLGLSFGAMAQGGLFQRGGSAYDNEGGYRDPAAPLLPGSHNLPTDVDGEPLTDGVLLLAGLAGAYLLGKKRKD